MRLFVRNLYSLSRLPRSSISPSLPFLRPLLHCFPDLTYLDHFNNMDLVFFLHPHRFLVNSEQSLLAFVTT